MPPLPVPLARLPSALEPRSENRSPWKPRPTQCDGQAGKRRSRAWHIRPAAERHSGTGRLRRPVPQASPASKQPTATP